MSLPTTAVSTRHIRTMWQGDPCWHWKALYVGHAQPLGYRNYRLDRWRWKFHFTPIHVSRDGHKWAVGLCFGKRMIYLYSHR